MGRKQPICAGLSPDGELQWIHKSMERWQIVQLFYKQYTGDFGEQWMRLILYNQGVDWS